MSTIVKHSFSRLSQPKEHTGCLPYCKAALCSVNEQDICSGVNYSTHLTSWCEGSLQTVK